MCRVSVRRPTVDEGSGRRRVLAAQALAASYLAMLFLDAVGTGLPQKILPRPVAFFVQAAQLFPDKAEQIIEWRAKGWRCATARFEELDLRPHFPIHSEDKENRFDRAMFFYLRAPRVLKELDRFISEREAALGPEHRIGGVMLLSLRRPIPPPGSPEARYQRVPLDQIAFDRGAPTVERKYWYVTPTDERERRCQASP
jgi:hypothetical protein